MRQDIPVTGGLMAWRVFCARIQGVSPLLMHSPRNMRGAEAVGRKKIPTPEDEAEAGTYRMADGTLCVLADHVREAMLAACSGLRVARKPAKPLVAAGLAMLDPEFPLMRNGKAIKEIDGIDVRRAVVQRQGIMRARGKVEPPWECLARFQVDVSILTDSALLVQVLEEAGSRVGIMDYRPQKGGVFGRFSVVEAWTEDM